MLTKYILLFFIYSFCGWFMEVMDTKFQTKKWVNRGFLMGPICPIYGVGCLTLVTFLSKYQNDPFIVFWMAIIVCSFIEYGTSYVMEKLFKLRWWDYSDKKFNLNGRICLETMLPFGILGVFVVYVAGPGAEFLADSLSVVALNALAFILLTIFVIDFVVSFSVIINLESITKNIKKDSTEEIVKAVHKFVENNMFLYRRLISAFPEMTKIIKSKQEKINKKLEKEKLKRKKKIEKLQKKIEKIKLKD
jgi:uncharacterized membrane protein